MRLLAGLFFVVMLLPRMAAAEWPIPGKAVTIVAPYGAGGSADRVGRVIADYIGRVRGITVVVENRVGAGGLVGSRQVARAAPDGHTLLVSGVAAQIMAPLVNQSISLDPIQDFAHIAYVGGPALGWAVYPRDDLKTLADLIRANKRGDLATYATPGTGTVGHLLAELVAEKLGLHMTAIGFNTQNLADVLSGRIPLLSSAWTTIAPQVEAGKLRGVAIAAPTRHSATPDVPTFRELGHDVVATTWNAISGPKGMSAETIQAINSLVSQALQAADVRRRLVDDIEDRPMAPAELTSLFAEENARWVPIARGVLK